MGNVLTNSFLVLLGQERSIRNVALFFSVNAAAVLILICMAGFNWYQSRERKKEERRREAAAE